MLTLQWWHSKVQNTQYNIHAWTRPSLHMVSCFHVPTISLHLWPAYLRRDSLLVFLLSSLWIVLSLRIELRVNWTNNERGIPRPNYIWHWLRELWLLWSVRCHVQNGSPALVPVSWRHMKRTCGRQCHIMMAGAKPYAHHSCFCGVCGMQWCAVQCKPYEHLLLGICKRHLFWKANDF